jgi:hypothetical protein
MDLFLFSITTSLAIRVMTNTGESTASKKKTIMKAPEINLLIAWVWILLGFASGMLLGLGFHKENWLGGYTSLKRRMYRLGHISFFGLGAVNLMFYLTVGRLAPGGLLNASSWAMVAGAITMPLCCGLMAHVPRIRMLFAVPVVSLLLGASLVILSLLQGQHRVPPETGLRTVTAKVQQGL